MAKTLQHRRGTTAELASVTGAVGEIFMDTTKNTLVVFDGVIGNPGHTLATEDFVLANTGTGGASYDQSLNTIDDVVFNSALVGDVSVIGNTIAGVDSYGNATELLVDSNLTVQLDTTTITSASFSEPSSRTANYSPSNQTASGKSEIVFNQQYQSWSNAQLDALDAIQPGTVISYNMQSMSWGVISGTFTVTASNKTLDYYGFPVVTLQISNITGSSTWWNNSENISNINFTWSTSVASKLNVLSATETGVDVLKLNTPVITSGSNVLDIELKKLVASPITMTTSGQNWFAGSSLAFIKNTNNLSDIQFEELASAKPGSIFRVNNVYVPNIGTTYDHALFTVAYTAVSGSGTALTVNIYLNSALAAYDSYGNFQYNISGADYLTFSSVEFTGDVLTPYNAVSITPSGLTVNGQSVGADQSLNTTDNVIFNSALIGDVSIISNTISGIDSYGNPDKLIVDGKLDVAVPVTTTSTVNKNIYNTTQVFRDMAGDFVLKFRQDYGFTTTQLNNLLATPSGTQINFVNFTLVGYYGNTVIGDGHMIIGTPTSTADYYGNVTVSVPVTTLVDNTNTNLWNNLGPGSAFFCDSYSWSYSQSVTTSQTNLAVTATGVDVKGTLTVNGSPIGAVSAFGAVGTYAMLVLSANSGDINPGSTVTSTGVMGPLFFTGENVNSGGGAMYQYSMGANGTWMCMGYAPTTTNDMSIATLWYRVS